MRALDVLRHYEAGTLTLPETVVRLVEVTRPGDEAATRALLPRALRARFDREWAYAQTPGATFLSSAVGEVPLVPGARWEDPLRDLPERFRFPWPADVPCVRITGQGTIWITQPTRGRPTAYALPQDVGWREADYTVAVGVLPPGGSLIDPHPWLRVPMDDRDLLARALRAAGEVVQEWA